MDRITPLVTATASAIGGRNGREAREKICPYSHATRGNVDVTLEVIGG